MVSQKESLKELENKVSSLTQALEQEKQDKQVMQSKLNVQKETEDLLENQLEAVQADLEHYFIKFKQAEYDIEELAILQSNAIKSEQYKFKNIERKIEQHKNKIAELKQQISAKNLKLHNMSKRVKTLQTSLAEVKSNLKNEKTHVLSLKGKLKNKNTELTQVNIQLNVIQAELAKLLKEKEASRPILSKAMAAFVKRKKVNNRSLAADNDKLLELVKSSTFFDSEYYLAKNPDVVAEGIDPAIHYLKYGGFEGRNPSDKFQSAWYLKNNADVQAAKLNPLVHFLTYGQKEGRRPKKS